AAQREIAAAQREATQEAARAQQDVARDIERAQRDAHRARRDIEREHGRIAREAAQAQREAERAAHEIERAMSAIGRDRKREEHYGDKRMVDHQTKTFAAGNSPRVRLETFDGSVTVLAWDKPEVLMNATKRAGDEESLRAINLRAEQQGAEVVIKAERDQSKQLGDWNHDAVVSLEVYVPRGATVSVKSGDGRLRLEGVNGNVDMETGDGSIDVAQTRGRLRVQSGDGRVVVAGHEGAADVQTGDGRITLAGRFAELNARTGDGTITLEMASDTDATIETHSEHVTSDGLAVSETGAADTGQRVRRWRVGGGSGKLFRLQTGDGHIFLRRR
ncbi:MAG: DUF4097 family beta strand repeat-containing protein, partial [Pyrinomonadaceae bacterium]